MTNEEIEEKIKEKNLNGPRLTLESILDKIENVTYTNLPSGKSIVCEITMKNGFTVRGESACISIENFDQEIGNEIAYNDALNKVWVLEGYLLQEQLYNKEK